MAPPSKTCANCNYVVGVARDSSQQTSPRNTAQAPPPAPPGTPQPGMYPPPIPNQPIPNQPSLQPQKTAPSQPFGTALPWALSGLFGFGLVIVVFLLLRSPTPAQPQSGTIGTASQVPTAVVLPTVRPGPSFADVDARMDDRGFALTEAQKQDYWQSVAGTQITWRGQVTEVELNGGGEIYLRVGPKTYTSDTVVNLDGTQMSELPKYSKGASVTIQGLLQDHSSFGYTISQGHIIG